jgi:lipoprotein-anchoring transpeptidase ErfK/SrfK
MRRQNSKDGRLESSEITVLVTIATVLCLAAAPAFAKEFTKAPAQLATSSEAGTRCELLVSIQDRKLAVIEDGRVVKIYRVAVGTRRTPSPRGRFKIVNRIPNPAYYHSGRVIGPGRGNPLGNRWMGLDAKGYGIHGTNEPSSIGHAASHGCIRMGRRDVEDLFSRVRVGDIVEIYRSPSAEVAAIFRSDATPGARLKNVAVVKPASARAAAERATEF